MKEKIFQALKQEFASLGLGDEILMAHAESLATLGLVTDMNLKTVVEGQKSFLEGLQKFNDRRAADAAKTARENAKKEFEDEAKKKAEEAAKQKADEEAKKKAEEEAKRKAEEEASKGNKEFQELMAQMKAQNEKFEALTKQFTDYKQENEKTKAEQAKTQRDAFIMNKAKEMGIPQSRIDEGFFIKDDMDEKGISEYLGKVAANAKANQLPTSSHQQILNGEATQSEIDAIAAAIVK